MSQTVSRAADEADAPGRSHPSPTLEFAVIALGGAIGAWLRHALSITLATTTLHPAFATVSANVLGSFLLGQLIGLLEMRPAHRLVRPFLAIGVFGSFTTFSALALDHRTIAMESGEGQAAAYVVGSILMGLTAFVLGRWLSRRARGPGRP